MSESWALCQFYWCMSRDIRGALEEGNGRKCGRVNGIPKRLLNNFKALLSPALAATTSFHAKPSRACFTNIPLALILKLETKKKLNKFSTSPAPTPQQKIIFFTVPSWARDVKTFFVVNVTGKRQHKISDWYSAVATAASHVSTTINNVWRT